MTTYLIYFDWRGEMTFFAKKIGVISFSDISEISAMFIKTAF